MMPGQICKMPAPICARCGAKEAPYFAEIPDVAKGSHNTVWLCKQHAQGLAEIARLYGECAPIFDLGAEDRPVPICEAPTITPLPGLEITLTGAMADRVTEVTARIRPPEASE